MDEKYIWPLLGVFLGWVLTSIAGGFKERQNRKQLLGSLLTKLMRVESQLSIIINTTENMKDIADSWEEYEPIRKGVINRHFLEPESVIADLKSAIDGVAPLYPMLAIELEGVFELLLKNKKASLVASSKNREAYIRMLSVYEVGLDVNQKSIKKIINKLAIRHSIFTYIQLQLVKHKKRKGANAALASASGLMDEISTQLKKTS